MLSPPILISTASIAVCVIAYLLFALVVFFATGRDPKVFREIARLWPWRRR